MKLIVTAPVNETGIGLMNKEIIKALSKNPRIKSLSWVPVGQVSLLAEEKALFDSLYFANHEYSKEAVSLVMNQPAASFGHTTSRRANYTVFELDKFRPQEQIVLESQDVIFTPSQWGVDILKANGISCPCYSAPLGVDSNIFNPNVVASPKNTFRKSPDSFIVYFAGKLEKRKGIDAIIKAFNYAFSGHDNVELWLSCHNMFMSDQDYKNALKREVLNPETNALWYKTKVLPRVPTQKDLAEVMSQTNIGLFLSRAEGWGMESAEMLAMGKPCIMTNYSGHTEYNEYFYIVNIEETEPAVDGIWFHGHGNWANLTEKVILNAAYDLKCAFNAKTPIDINHAYPFIGRYTWENTAKYIIDGLNEVFYLN